MTQQYELKDIKKGESTTSSPVPFEEKNNVPSFAFSFVSKIKEVKEEKEKQLTQMIKSFTAPKEEVPAAKEVVSTTMKTDKIEATPEQSNVVFEKITGLTSYVDGGKEMRKITVEEQVVKKGDTKKKAVTVTETKKSLLGFLSDKLTKRDEVKGEMNVIVKLLLGNEYNITLDHLEGHNFDTLMDKVRALSAMDKEPSDAPVAPVPTTVPTDPQYYAFLSMVTNVEIISFPPYTCRITSLSKSISHMVNLQKLKIENQADVYHLPQEFAALKCLEELSCIKLALRSLPAEVLQLTRLKYINLSSNNITSLPTRGMASLSALEKLILANNQISSLPIDFILLRKLTYLDLSKNKFDPNTLAPILVDLCTSNTSVPLVSSSPPSLSFFTSSPPTVAASPLSQLNGGGGGVGATLLTLNLSGNRICALPLSFAKLTTLKDLDLSQNEIAQWPTDVINSLTNLTALDLSVNRIPLISQDLPENLTLTRLVMCNNLIKKIPSSLCENFPNMIELDFSSNKLVKLPKEFTELQSLQTVLLNSNEISEEFPRVLMSLTNVQRLEMSHNGLLKWLEDDSVLRGMVALKTLVLQGNKLKNIGTGIGLLTNLTNLDISCNSIEAIPHQIKQLQNCLVSLHMHSNLFEELPIEFSTLHTLQELSVVNISVNYNRECSAIDSATQVDLRTLTNIARSAPHPLLVVALGQLAERDELHQQLLDAGTIELLVHFTNSTHADIQLNASKSLSILSTNDNLRADLYKIAGARLFQLVRSPNAEISGYAFTTLGNIAFDDSVQEAILAEYGTAMFRAIAKDPTVDLDVRQKSRRLIAILAANDYFLRPGPRKRGIRILTIDGGGTRGIATLELLKKFEMISGKKLHELFDLVGGTSTGAQLCTAMSVRKMQMELEEYERIYRDQCVQVFTTTEKPTSSADTPASSSQWASTLSSHWAKLALYSNVITTGAFYKSKNYEELMFGFYGDTALIDTVEDGDLKFFAVATHMNMMPAQPYIFRNYRYPLGQNSRYDGTCRVKIWQAMRASTAAPSYFDECVIGNDRFQDGGIVANNPSALAYHEAKCIWGKDVKIDCIVSLGTGRPPSKSSKSSLKDTILTLIDSATGTDRIHELLEDFMATGTYFRFNPVDDAFAAELDETRTEKLEAMQVAARKYISENLSLFEEVCKVLTKDL